ncbi:MAG: hypothetical protein PHT40_03240 [Patescibacteria group bacterium]|nr:hypothetical protein [Patescibacteria group bacterium]
MNNFFWFLLSTIVFSGIWYLIKKPKGKKLLKSVVIISLLSVPYNINNTIITPLGSGQGKNIFSLFSLYQRADKTSYSMLGGIYQRSNECSFAIFNLFGYQKADSGDVGTVFGLPAYQEASNDAETFIGLVGYQKAGSNAKVDCGLIGYQSAGKSVKTDISLAIYQTIPGKTRWFGIFSGLKKD